MTYLELCQKVREESGVSGTGPDSVTGQVGVLKKICTWVQEADLEVQRARRDWRFLWTRNSSSLSASQQEYTLAELNMSQFSTLQQVKVSGQRVKVVDWDEWLAYYDGDISTGPGVQVVTESPSGSLLFFPVPDSALPIQVDYFKSAARLLGNDDQSQIPDDYQDVVVKAALVKYAKFEEDQFLYQSASADYMVAFKELCRDQLPKVNF
ncbi:MAG: hypothetical protein ACK5M8_18865 [Shewanella algae]|uniref:phage adaptor protein n=1 Tax=Shewanella algae TaxID=38313 RepID=UPI0011831ABE|nr:hypothetical protein [Shewanella algae]TVK95369.1 hypothetical protein AYJ01_00855 [Shewanella algae]